MERASDLSWASEGMEIQTTIRPIATFFLFAGPVMELAIIADAQSLAPLPPIVISCEDRSRYESTRFLFTEFRGGRRHSPRSVSLPVVRRHNQEIRQRSGEAGADGRALEPPGYGYRHERLR